jgi:hypothetical protein
MFRYSTIAAALILVGSVAAASAAQPRVQRGEQGSVSAPVTRIDQDGNYYVDHTPGAIPSAHS